MSRTRLSLLVLLLVSACSSPQKPAPIVERSVKPSPKKVVPTPNKTVIPVTKAAVTPAPVASAAGPEATYTVKKGDTVFRIALDHGLAYRELAAWNGLNETFDIKVDQVLRLTSPDETTGVVEAGKVSVASIPADSAVAPRVESLIYPKALRIPYSDQAAQALVNQAEGPSVKNEKAKPTAQAKPTAKPESVAEKTHNSEENQVDWLLPTAGKVLKAYTESTKGIDIGGKMGQAIVAASSGKVVYSGSGLQGYGNLVIIKHNKELLSVYAHNRKLLVAEGDAIKKGEKIAEMGNSDAEQVKLHFEIRRFGKPVDPTKFITVDKP